MVSVAKQAGLSIRFSCDEACMMLLHSDTGSIEIIPVIKDY